MSRAETLPSAYPGSIFFQLQAVAVYSMAAFLTWLKARGRGAAPEAAAAATMRTWRLCRSTVAWSLSAAGESQMIDDPAPFLPQNRIDHLLQVTLKVDKTI